MVFDSRGFGSGLRVFAFMMVLCAAPVLVPLAPAAAQNAVVTSNVTVQVLRAAGFDLDEPRDDDRDDDHRNGHHGGMKHGGHHDGRHVVNIRAEMDDTAASIVTHDARGERRMITLLSRANPLRVAYDTDEAAPTYIQIMY